MLLVYVSKEDNYKFAKFNGITEFVAESKKEEFEELRESSSVICITKDFTIAPTENEDGTSAPVTYDDVLSTLMMYSAGNPNFKEHEVRYFKSLDWWRERTMAALEKQGVTKIHEDLLESTIEGIWSNLDDLYDLFNDKITEEAAEKILIDAVKITFCDKE